jgi:hypothetical protein
VFRVLVAVGLLTFLGCDAGTAATDAAAAPTTDLPYLCQGPADCPPGASCEDGQCRAPIELCDLACRTCDEERPCSLAGACFEGSVAGPDFVPGICVLNDPATCLGGPPACMAGACPLCVFGRWTCVLPGTGSPVVCP